MREVKATRLVAWLALVVCAACGGEERAADPLPSWNDGAAKQAIVAFVERVTEPDGPDYVPPEARVAVFDNDGTLWSEQPIYFQVQFAIDRVPELARSHPEWRSEEPFRSVLEGHAERVLTDQRALIEILGATQTGMSEREYADAVREWADESRHPRFGVRYRDLVYQPMLELLEYLRESGFTTWIVSGGDVAFMRPWAEETYGIPRERIIGSMVVLRVEEHEDGAEVVREPSIEFVDDGPGKVIAIDRIIGRRPILAVGNSDGDLEMLAATTDGEGPRFAAIVHHTDGEREWAYDRESHVGRLDRALDAAAARGWTVVDMRRDWRVVYPFER